MCSSTDTKNYSDLLAALAYAGLDRGNSPKACSFVTRKLISSQLAVELRAT